jgi:signal transduction histidine kinase
VSQGQFQQVGLQMTNRAFTRFAHVIGYICIAGAMLDAIGYQGAEPTKLIWPILFPLLVTLVGLLALDRWRTTYYTVLFLLLGGFTEYLLATTLLSPVHGDQGPNTPALTLVKIALIFVTGSGFVPRSSAVWCTIGFVVGEGASAIAALSTGAPVRLGLVSTFAWIGVLAIQLTVMLTRTHRLALRRELDQAALDEEMSALRYEIEVKAAALMHDMVLNHLAAIATGAEGALSPELKVQIERDLEILIGEEWLSDPSPDVDVQARADWQRSSLFAAVREARDLALHVEVTGDLGAVGRLDSERDTALGLATKQCLVNVLRHAEVEHAEVVVIGSDAEVSVMVIDAGRGFSEHLVGADRLGLRQSVRRRIESVGGDVQVWSTPGRGTSVMIRVPAAQRVEARDE